MNELRFAFRQLLKNPGFTLVAVLLLTVGIGGNTAMFSVVDALALRPLAARYPNELVGCYSQSRKPEGGYRAFSYPNFVDLRQRNTVFTSVAAQDWVLAGLKEGETTRRVLTAVVSTDYFPTFGVRLAAGRNFTAEEERPGSAVPVVIASYSYWERTGKDPSLVGQTLLLNNRRFTVVGVAPEHFTGTTAVFAPEFWVPLGVYEWLSNDFRQGNQHLLADRRVHCLKVLGRLKTGLSLPAAQAQLGGLASQLESAYPEVNKDQTFVLSLLPRWSMPPNPQPGNQASVLAVLLLSMSGIVLLIACLNLTNLLLARGTTRRKEIAIRLALGGGRARVIRQLLAEGFLLSLLGGALGLWLAAWSTQLLGLSLASHLPSVRIEVQYTPDWRVLVATIGFCVASTLLFALGPAWKLARTELVTHLKEQTGDNPPPRLGRLVFASRNLLVVGQLAFTLALLTAAGLFTRGALKAAQADPGFRMDQGLLLEVDAGLAGYDEQRGRQVYGTLLERLSALPGVASAALAYTVPFGLFDDATGVRPAGWASKSPKLPPGPEAGKSVNARFNIVTGSYFKTLGIALLRGREFDRLETEGTNSAPAAIVNQALAEQLWPGEDPVGRFLQLTEKKGGKEPEPLQVIGVVPSVRNDLTEKQPSPHVYVPFGQYYFSQANVHVRTSLPDRGAERALLPTLRQTVSEVDPALPALSLRTLRDFSDAGLVLWSIRIGARLFLVFGLLALFLAGIGIYGVKAYVVARQTREIAIRMALGADIRNILWQVLRDGAVLTVAGLGVGVLLSWATGRVLSNVLYGVNGMDPLVLGIASLVLVGASLLACYRPARRATRVDPIAALRCE